MCDVIKILKDIFVRFENFFVNDILMYVILNFKFGNKVFWKKIVSCKLNYGVYCLVIF